MHCSDDNKGSFVPNNILLDRSGRDTEAELDQAPLGSASSAISFTGH